MKQQEFEQQLQQIELSKGTFSQEYATCLEQYAAFLKGNRIDLLKGAYMAARAEVIRAKLRANTWIKDDVLPVDNKNQASVLDLEIRRFDRRLAGALDEFGEHSWKTADVLDEYVTYLRNNNKHKERIPLLERSSRVIRESLQQHLNVPWTDSASRERAQLAAVDENAIPIAAQLPEETIAPDPSEPSPNQEPDSQPKPVSFSLAYEFRPDFHQFAPDTSKPSPNQEPVRQPRPASFSLAYEVRPDSPQFDERIGTTIADHLRLTRFIGAGGMCSVYEAHDSKLFGTAVAVKILVPKLAKEKKNVLRFKQEVQALSKLNHPNIVRVFEHGKTDDRCPYLVMDLIYGETLTELIAAKKVLDIDVTLDIVLQVCSALEHAHALKVVHRDLKPSNIMLIRDELRAGSYLVKVVDFGIAKIVAEDANSKLNLTQTGEVFGSPVYMSPEQGVSGRRVDHRSDIYSLGCVMFECLTGLPPHLGDSAVQIMAQRQTSDTLSMKEATLGQDYPQDLEYIVGKMLKKSVDKRYQSIADVTSDIEQYQKNGLFGKRLQTFRIVEADHPQQYPVLDHKAFADSWPDSEPVWDTVGSFFSSFASGFLAVYTVIWTFFLTVPILILVIIIATTASAILLAVDIELIEAFVLHMPNDGQFGTMKAGVILYGYVGSAVTFLVALGAQTALLSGKEISKKSAILRGFKRSMILLCVGSFICLGVFHFRGADERIDRQFVRDKGIWLCENDHYKEAEPLLKFLKGTKEAHELLAETITSLRRQGKLWAAEDLSRSSGETVLSDVLEAEILLKASLYPKAAAAKLEAALASVKTPAVSAYVRSLLARAYACQGNTAQALEQFRKSIQAAEMARETLNDCWWVSSEEYADDINTSSRTLADLLVARHDLEGEIALHKELQEASFYETGGGSALAKELTNANPFSRGSYPRLTELERQVLGHTYSGDWLCQRLDRLEAKKMGFPASVNNNDILNIHNENLEYVSDQVDLLRKELANRSSQSAKDIHHQRASQQRTRRPSGAIKS